MKQTVTKQEKKLKAIGEPIKIKRKRSEKEEEEVQGAKRVRSLPTPVTLLVENNTEAMHPVGSVELARYATFLRLYTLNSGLTEIIKARTVMATVTDTLADTTPGDSVPDAAAADASFLI